jgi:NADH-quinone oxidoreductase subunit H
MIIFCLSPILSFFLSICLWLVLQLLDSYLTILLILAIGGLEIYGILLGGWSSQNKYTLIGSIRTTCQLVSYELILSMIYFLIIFSLGSFRFSYIYILPILPIYIYLPIYIISLIVILAETNRVPFDLPESK